MRRVVSIDVDDRIGGAYGLAFAGISPGPAAMEPAPRGWPVVRLEHAAAGEVPGPGGPDRAVIPLRGGGAIAVDRSDRSATFFTARPPDRVSLTHPLASVVAGAFSRWLGREVLHAGGVVGPDGGVWAIMAGREGGKSTTLAALALADVPVLSDDLLVVDGAATFRGPRCIDLRTSAAHALGVEGGATPVRDDRRRLCLPPVAAELPLTGLIFLEWESGHAVKSLGLAARMRLLARHRAGGFVPGPPEAALALADLPAFEIRRPRTHDGVSETAAAIRGVMGGT
ncbi:MAG TPA: hypothetical protein VJT75_04515 [Thermoleophilaceae bacterium]|nr:hypothetical protein [Thermoleophilaceae bacterium]